MPDIPAPSSTTDTEIPRKNWMCFISTYFISLKAILEKYLLLLCHVFFPPPLPPKVCILYYLQLFSKVHFQVLNICLYKNVCIINLCCSWIPYLKICLHTKIYLYSKINPLWAFRVFHIYLQNGEKFELYDMQVLSQDCARP